MKLAAPEARVAVSNLACGALSIVSTFLFMIMLSWRRNLIQKYLKKRNGVCSLKRGPIRGKSPLLGWVTMETEDLLSRKCSSPESVPLRQEFPLKSSPHRVLLHMEKPQHRRYCLTVSPDVFLLTIQPAVRPSAYKDSVPHLSSHIFSQP